MTYALAETNGDLAALELAAMTRNVVAFMLSRSAVATSRGNIGGDRLAVPSERGNSEEKAATPQGARTSAAVVDAVPKDDRIEGEERLTAATGEPGWRDSAAAVCFAGRRRG